MRKKIDIHQRKSFGLEEYNSIKETQGNTIKIGEIEYTIEEVNPTMSLLDIINFDKRDVSIKKPVK